MAQPVPLLKGKEITLPRRYDTAGNVKSRAHSPPLTKDIRQHPHIKEGIEEAEKSLVKEQLKNDEMINELVDRSQSVLFRTQSVFPFDFFPDEISIGLTKVAIVNRQFFSSGTTQSVYIKDIMDIIVDSGPFFATLKIIDVSFAENKLVVEYLAKKDALKARRLIEGLTVASKMNIDLTKVNKKHLINHIEDLGKLRDVTPA